MRRGKKKKDTAPCKPRKLSTEFCYFKQRSDNVMPFFSVRSDPIKESDFHLGDIVGICTGEVDVLKALPVCLQQNAL
jgi:hypothetical protein